MLTIIIGCLTGVLLGGTLGMVWQGHPVWASLLGVTGFFGVMIGVNLLMRRKMEAIFKGVQAHIEESQEQLRRRIQIMQNKNMSGGKGLQKRLEKEQTDSIVESIALLDQITPLKRWNIMAERQANTLRGQLYYQIKDFGNAKRCLEKSLVPTPDPLTLAMKMALMYKAEAFDDLAKAFRRGVKRFKDDKSVILYALYSWVLVSQGKFDEAQAVLDEGKDQTDDETIRRNWEHVANGRVKQFSNAGVGEQWYALHLEAPKPVKARQGRFGGGGRMRHR